MRKQRQKMKRIALKDYEDFIHHVMRGYEKTQEGLDMLLDQGLISKEEYISRSRQNFRRYKTKAEDFARRRFGEAWQSALEDIKNFTTK